MPKAPATHRGEAELPVEPVEVAGPVQHLVGELLQIHQPSAHGHGSMPGTRWHLSLFSPADLIVTSATRGVTVPVKTRGIRHIHLLVSDHDRSVAFYQRVFGMEVGFRDGNILFLRSPGRADDLALHLAVSDDERARVGQPGGCEHFGITVEDRTELDDAVALVLEAGGALVDKGEHAPGVPYAYVADPDGYVIEI